MLLTLAKVESFSVKDEDEKTYEKFKELRWRDKKSVSELVNLAWKEYLEKHADGNPNFLITDYQDPTFKACPAFFRNKKAWSNYFKSLDKKGLTDYTQQANLINQALKEAKI